MCIGMDNDEEEYYETWNYPDSRNEFEFIIDTKLVLNMSQHVDADYQSQILEEIDE